MGRSSRSSKQFLPDAIMPQKILSLATALTELSIVACAEGDYDGSQLITADALMRETEVLSADDMEGRGTGQPGGENRGYS